MQASNMHIRRALRAYHCYGCNNDFKEMVNLNDPSSIQCPSCHSDFLEEKKYYDEAVRAQQA